MSEANRVAFVFEASESDGTPITPAGDGVELPFSSDSLTQETDRQNSELIRDDRQVKDRIRTNVSTSGDLGFELLYAAFDQLFEAALQSVAWNGALGDASGTDIQATASNEFISGTVSTFTGFAGRVVRVSGFANAANNGFFLVDSVTTTTLTDDTLNVSQGTLVVEAAGPSITIEASQYITNGVRQQVFTLEREYADLSSNFALFTGMVIDAMAMEINAEGIVNGTFSWVGKTEASTSATFVSGSLTAAPDNPVYNTIDNVPRIREGDTDEIAADECATAVTINVANNSRPRNCIGKLGPDSYGSGTAEVTGTLTMFYATKTLADKHLNDTASSLFIVLEDSSNQAYIIEIPQLKYDGSPRVAGGLDTDVSVELTWGAYRHATKGYTIRIHRLA